MASPTDAVVVADLVVRRHGVEVLHGVGLRIPVGRVVGLLGPSGCGKTTLMRAIIGTQKTASGDVNVFGRPAGHQELRRSIGYMAQSPALYDDLTVEQNLNYFRQVLGLRRAEIGRTISEVGLGASRSALLSRLSGGQRSRVSLAIALLGDPRLLVLDEPTVGLDPVLRNELWQLFAARAAAGTTILVSSHVMDEARRCERLLLMRDGRIVADDTPDGLLASTGTNDHDAAFLALIRRSQRDAGEQT